jgi:hypothetical protein
LYGKRRKAQLVLLNQEGISRIAGLVATLWTTGADGRSRTAYVKEFRNYTTVNAILFQEASSVVQAMNPS